MLVHTVRLIGASAFLLAAATARLDAQTIDQQQTQTAAVALGSSTGTGQYEGWLFQAFTPSQGTSAGAGFLLASVNNQGTGTLTIQLWNAPPSSGGAGMLASGSTALGSATTYYDAFWHAVAVTPGHEYTLAFYSPQAYFPLGTYSDGNNYTGVGGNGGNGGRYDYNYSQTVTDPYQGNRFGTSAFREYSTGTTTTTTTPEPSSMALLGTGLIGLVTVARRRLKQR